MAEGFEPYHVPQQSRRDKLRVVAAAAAEPVNLHGLMLPPPPPPPSYDPASLIISSSSDLLTSTPTTKEETMNNNNSCSSNLMGLNSNFRNPYLADPQFHDINSNPAAFFQYSSQVAALQNDDDQVVVFKPEPLSLSLSSSSYSPHHHHNNNNNNSSSSNSNLSAIYGSTVGPNDGVSKGSVPLGPFTGYASILKGSRFLRPAQQLLEEFCDVGSGGAIGGEKLSAADSSLMDPQVENLSADGSLIVDHHDDPDHHRHQLSGSSDIGVEIRKKKSRLISMLDEVYRRYKQYYQQMQAVVTTFEYVAGLGNAAPYANLAVKAMTRHFKCLKNAIMDQLQFNKDSAHASHGNDEAPMFRNSNRGLYGQRSIHSSGFLEHQPVWRPQRGLPERAVTVLRAWLFEHFLHPYPTDTDKLMLAKQTGLSRSQVSNWFINARVRLWKPMVEEIHMLETRQAQKSSQREDRNANRPTDHMPSANSLASENPSTSTHRVQDPSSKRTRNELPNMPVGSEEMNLSYENLPSHLQVDAAGMNMGGGSNGVSLTLGLHQNNGISLSEPFPINAAQRFGLGLEGNNEGYSVMSTFEAQNRHFGRDVIGGQLLHDFVG